MKKLSLLVPLFAVLFVSTAHAGQTFNGYVCETHYNPAVTNYGQHGLLVFQMYADANCTGTFLGSFIICSTGATNTNCDPAFVHSEAQILAVWQQLVSAMAHSIGAQVFGEPGGSNKTHFLSLSKN